MYIRTKGVGEVDEFYVLGMGKIRKINLSINRNLYFLEYPAKFQ